MFDIDFVHILHKAQFVKTSNSALMTRCLTLSWVSIGSSMREKRFWAEVLFDGTAPKVKYIANAH